MTLNMTRAHTAHPLSLSLIGLAVLLLSACDSEGTNNNGGDDAGTMVIRPGGDDGGTESGTEGGTMAGTMSGTMSGTMAGMMSGTEGGTSSRSRTIETCEDLCGVYDSCGTAVAPWEEGCMEGCMGEDWEDNRFRSYLVCLKIEPCESLSSCRIPPPPLPSCEEACALTDACEADFRLPMGLTQMGTCGSACADNTWARQISVCVQENSDDLCDEEGFARCLLEERGGDCLDACEARAGCEEGVDVVDCTIECLMAPTLEDPLAERRRQQQRDCVTNAQGCEAVSACLEPPAPPVTESVSAACTAGEACGLFVEGACPEVMAEVASELSADGVACLASSLEASCESDLTACFAQRLAPSMALCASYCEAANLCDTLGEQSEFDCLEQCNNDPTTFSGNLACAEASSCESFTSCAVGGAGLGGCESFCASVASCGVETEAACLARCEPLAGTTRSHIERSCGALLSCEAQASVCELPPAPDCASYCEPLSACGLADNDCVRACDNAHLADPEPFLLNLACVNSSERCDERAACESDASAGAACVAFCEQTVSCEGSSEALERCVVSCARGELSAEDEARFVPAMSCLASAEASCEARGACFEQGELASLCADACEGAAACGFELGAEGCLASCEADPEAFGVLPGALACMGVANARDEGCAGLAACVGVEAPVPTPACASLCASQRACEPALDLFLCHASCLESDEGDATRASCANIVGCDELDTCLTGDASLRPECVASCEGLAMSCGEQFGEGARFADTLSCEAACSGVILARGAESAQGMSECVSGAISGDPTCSDEALSACFAGELAPGSEEICARSFAVLNLCQFPIPLPLPDEATFMMDCAAEFAADPAATIAKVECLEDAQASDPSCLSALGCGLF